MKRARSGPSALARLGILGAAAGLSLIGGGRAQGGDPLDDGAPSGTVAFFSGSACPPGWKPADDLPGRIPVAVIDPMAVGVKVGKPLGDAEDRAHGHPFGASLTLADKSLAAADGGNQSGAAAGMYMVSGSTDPAPTGLPFIQVLACAKP
jgi:hypothetical protein